MCSERIAIEKWITVVIVILLLFASFATKVHLEIDVNKDEFTEIVVYILAIQTSNCR